MHLRAKQPDSVRVNQRTNEPNATMKTRLENKYIYIKIETQQLNTKEIKRKHNHKSNLTKKKSAI